MKRIAIFASGAGSTAEAIIQYLKSYYSLEVALIVCNRKAAGVVDIAAQHDIEALLLTDAEVATDGFLLTKVTEKKIDCIALAGFLRLVPTDLVLAFTGRITNIHPSLLPAFGGKGMYGGRVHASVVDSNATETGMTIHAVNAVYDDGAVLRQAKCPVLPDDTPEMLAARVQALEQYHYPRLIAELWAQPNVEVLYENIQTRRSVFPKSYIQNGDLSRKTIELLLTSAVAAPNHKRTEPWRFKVFVGESKTNLGVELQKLYTEHTSIDAFSQKKHTKIGYNMQAAACVIAIVMEASGLVPQPEEEWAVACAVQNMWLMAHGLCLGAYWSTGFPTFKEEPTKKLFFLQKNELFLGFFYVGFHSQPPQNAVRVPLDKKVDWYL